MLLTVLFTVAAICVLGIVGLLARQHREERDLDLEIQSRQARARLRRVDTDITWTQSGERKQGG